MDSEKEKEKPLPEKSPGIASADEAKNESKSDHHDTNQDPSKNQSATTPAPLSDPDPSTEVNEAKPDIVEEISKVEEIQEDPSTAEIQIQEEKPTEAETGEPKPEPEPTPLPHPDLAKVSEEIDAYISILSNSKSNESTPPDVPISVAQFCVLVEAKIDEYDSTEHPVKWSQPMDEDTASLLEAVDRISKLSSALCEFSSEDKFAHWINRTSGVHQRAMSYLEEEFRSVLEDHKTYNADQNNESKIKQSNQDADESSVSEPEPVEENQFPAYSEEVTSNLKKLAKALIIGGHEEECYHVYYIARRLALDESLHKVGFGKHSIDDVQKMNWEYLESEIDAWNITFKQCAAVHFPNERKLSDAVFNDNPSVSESLFSNLSRGITILLFSFAESIAMTKRSAEKLFKFLDIYETLRDVLPKMEVLFPPEFTNELKSEATLTRGRLGEAIISTFCELENSIKSETGKTPVAGGAVHPLTRYVLNYLKYACEYKDTFDQVFRLHQKIERADATSESEFDSNAHGHHNNDKIEQSPFQVQIMKVMELLDSNLDAKSKLYRDIPLSMIFLMNNGRYIVQKIQGSTEISSLLSDTWRRKRSTDLRQYHKNYQRETWGKLLNCLMNHEGLNVNGKVVKPVLKERFKTFNAMFEEIHKTQSTWIISDEQLQSELRVSISNMVVPAYRSFMGRFSQYFTAGRQTEKYIKFQPEDVETYIYELFDGNAGFARK